MKLSNLLQSVTQNTASIDGVRWYPVRPMTAENTFFIYRVKAAWRVLVGVSDAIEWDYPFEDVSGAIGHNQQQKAHCKEVANSNLSEAVKAARGGDAPIPFKRW